MLTRRSLLTLPLAGSAAILAAQDRAARAVRGLPSPKIKDVSVIATAPEGLRLVVVKITTDQDGLYGYGCGTFTQRADLVVAAVERYLKPFLIGKPADRIEDIWNACYNSSYWRNGPVLNNAISGVDQALWDIKGRQANMPVYQLLGGKVREAADCYGHAAGSEISESIDNGRKWIDQGFRFVRLQVGVPGMDGYGAGRGNAPAVARPAGTLHTGPVFEPAFYARRALKLFEEARKQLGDEIELLHDVHERLHPIQAVQLAKDMEKFRLFFLEDLLSPEDIAYFKMIRQQCTTQLAMGELFNSVHEWRPLIEGRLIDFIRIHVSQCGGLSPARKIIAFAEQYGVRSAWHGPGDVSPIGHAAQITLDITAMNFGVQEYSPFGERTREVFSGLPEMKQGYWYATEAPGWGIEIDEKAAAKYPYGNLEQGTRKQLNGGWGEIRRRDGTIIKQ
jgi:mannonate dehydratase